MVDSSKVLCQESIGDNVKDAQYAVRGFIVQLAGELAAKLEKGEKLPFEKILYCNIGNPLSLGQPTLSFDREVVSVALNPKLMDSADISKDAKDRAKKILDTVKYPYAVGAYTASQGLLPVRESIKNYIEARDGYPSDINKIFLTDGASDGIRTLFNILIRGPQDAVMIPIPQYPLYSALISLLNGTAVPYYLDESKGWALDMQNFEENYNKAKAEGKTIRAVVVINPGNPTGQVMTADNLKDIITFCQKNKIVILADEVYQMNIYTEKPFISFKKMINDMGKPYNEVELASFHSTSKGIIGECGLRGGYMELMNFGEFAFSQILKLRSICLCSNTVGQITTEVMVNPPKEGVNSPEVVERHKKEVEHIFGGLKARSKILAEKLNSIPGLKTNVIEGAMYAFPSVFLTESAIKAAKEQGIAPDGLYCKEVLEETGIVIVPGTGFRQKEGTFHFRITNLIYNTEEFDKALDSFKAFNERFFKKYP